MVERNMTTHARYDRFDRLSQIIDLFGDLGEVVNEKFFRDTPINGSYWRQITDKGVIIVLSADRRHIVTGWLATVHQVTEIYDGRRLPQYLYNRIQKNKKIVLDKSVRR